MASPLTRTKVRTTGERYMRPRVVEDEIDYVLTLPPAERRRRGRLQDPGAKDYLRSETLVHLLRLDIRQGGSGDPYMATLIRRCQANLNGTILSSVPQAVQLRKDILQEFSVFFAENLAAEADAIDFFECRFNAAFSSLRIEKYNQHMRRQGRVSSKSADDQQVAIDREGAARTGTTVAAWKPQRGEDRVYLRQVVAFLKTLPSDQQAAIVCCRVMDMTQREAAERLGVDERTIRNLLTRADEMLARIKESA
ncbi:MULTISPECIES: sigma factor-like helix-turn-helix DNA-binding protein [unclassified Mesorhizobium]|uniref:RNA polymerase sigma factor n=1 Tax=unclassified Mesorhizobium TaxID=325217 RepID=UPI0016750881|nr:MULTISPECIES: sigma factor-like helix-turn-helix DNA-binding protein [unclassified Mesorhizobium]